MNREQMDSINNRIDQLVEEGIKSEVSERVSSEIKPCKVKKLLNDEIVTGMLNPDGSFTDIQVVGEKEYEKPDDDKVGTKILDCGVDEKVIWVEDVLEELKKQDATNKPLPVYKRVWKSTWVYYSVGYIDANGEVILRMPRFQDTDSNISDLNSSGYPKTVEKYSTTWYRDSDLTNYRTNIKVSFIPSNDVYEIINTNKNESIGYVSHEGNVIYWNQYRS